MINKFEKQLEKWNGGVLRGAQAKLAKLLNVSTATVALWATGKRRPSKGYAAKMAQLFGLDGYDVMRLFAPTTTYPDLQPCGAVHALRDSSPAENTYTVDTPANYAQTNSIKLPCLARVPQNWPQYDESDVLEWWTLPRRCAKVAKYLLPAQAVGQAGQDVFYFIKPETDASGKCWLVPTPSGFALTRTQTPQTVGQVVLQIGGMD